MIVVMVYAGTGCIETLLYLEDGLVTRCERLFLDVFPLSAARIYLFSVLLAQGLVNIVVDRFNSDV